MWHIHTHARAEYYSATKRNNIMLLADTWMDVETGIQSEISHKEKIKYCIYVGSRKMVKMNLFAKQKYRHRHRGKNT